jgi:hypothetical protein
MDLAMDLALATSMSKSKNNYTIKNNNEINKIFTVCNVDINIYIKICD